jgi:hypothetical protein
MSKIHTQSFHLQNPSAMSYTVSSEISDMPQILIIQIMAHDSLLCRHVSSGSISHFISCPVRVCYVKKVSVE